MPDQSNRYSKATQARADEALAVSGVRDEEGTLIYALTDLATGEVRYVGCCANGLRYRLVRHFDHAVRGGHWPAVEWIRESGYTIGVKVLERNPADPREAELRWIHHYRDEGARLTNRLTITEEHKAKIAAWNHKRFEDPAARRRVGDIWRGRSMSAETRAKLAAANTGRRHTEEAKAKMSAARLGVPKSEETKANMRAAQARRKGVI